MTPTGTRCSGAPRREATKGSRGTSRTRRRGWSWRPGGITTHATAGSSTGPRSTLRGGRTSTGTWGTTRRTCRTRLGWRLPAGMGASALAAVYGGRGATAARALEDLIVPEQVVRLVWLKEELAPRVCPIPRPLLDKLSTTSYRERAYYEQVSWEEDLPG